MFTNYYEALTWDRALEWAHGMYEPSSYFSLVPRTKPTIRKVGRIWKVEWQEADR